MPAKRKPGTPAEYEAFSNVLRKVLRVSHAELQSRLAAEKKAKKRKIKRASASRDAAERR
ncbi:MAG TPA: hypothetical protein VN777_15545 [Terriglobales bacterium]|jgi:hypothetical protein|nr:hypothetical protein [Terriglobales bacterium]